MLLSLILRESCPFLFLFGCELGCGALSRILERGKGGWEMGRKREDGIDSTGMGMGANTMMTGYKRGHLRKRDGG
jgi:hypothetical protein